MGPDGAHFEASTAYHRFALELLAAADRFAAAAGLDACLSTLLGGMYRYAAGYLGPGGREPGFGDGDEGRCLPFVTRDPRDHAYLASVGAARLGDPALRIEGAPFAEEAIWLHGAEGWRRVRSLPSSRPARAASFPAGGVHVLRAASTSVAMRCGDYGQRGVGGHAHNDQLALIVALDGAPLVIDSGTHCYTRDPMWRDRFRGTAAHSTVIVDGSEQTELFNGRPFALPGGRGGRLLRLGEQGDIAFMVGEHEGYRRLAAGVRHTREVLLDRRLGAVVARDTLTGRGSVHVEGRFHLGERAARAGSPEELRRARATCAGAPWADGLEAAGVVVVLDGDGRLWAALLPLGDTPALDVVDGWYAPRYGELRRSVVVRWAARGGLPLSASVAMVRLPRPTEVARG